VGPPEQEFRFALTPPEYARLRSAWGGPRTVVRQANHYLDSPSGALRSRGYGLRLRIENGRRQLLTLKGPPLEPPGERHLGMSVRAEIEADLSPQAATALLTGGGLLADLGLPLPNGLEACRGEHVQVFGRLETERSLHAVALPEAPPGFRGEFALDRVHFPNGTVEHELEVEWTGPPGRDLARALHDLLRGLGIQVRPQSLSKLARLLRCCGLPGAPA
jgi:uncharacterized protein YjbK